VHPFFLPQTHEDVEVCGNDPSVESQTGPVTVEGLSPEMKLFLFGLH
jgi:hypothetical protein